MWLATKHGFFSVVQSDIRKDQFMVRARAEKDLENLITECVSLKGKRIKKSLDSDYMFRIFISKQELDILMIFISDSINYSNFKDKIHTIKNQKDKVPYYMKIWNVMFDYQVQLHGLNYDVWAEYYTKKYGKNIWNYRKNK